jgi:hypothetical protein
MLKTAMRSPHLPPVWRRFRIRKKKHERGYIPRWRLVRAVPEAGFSFVYTAQTHRANVAVTERSTKLRWYQVVVLLPILL